LIGFDALLAWLTLLAQVVAVDLILGGDNAIAIALSTRRLPADLLPRVALFGTIGAIVCRLALSAFASALLAAPYVKIVCGLLLLAIAVRLVSPVRGSGLLPKARGWAEGAGPRKKALWSAIGLILLADAAMSLDNVVAVAGIANGNLPILAAGFALSIPLTVYGGAILSGLVRQAPQLALAGAVLIGWLGGALMVRDAAVAQWTALQAPALLLAAPFLSALFVYCEGRRGLLEPRRGDG
jgi:YjbE family integral membrane protein